MIRISLLIVLALAQAPAHADSDPEPVITVRPEISRPQPRDTVLEDLLVRMDSYIQKITADTASGTEPEQIQRD